MPFYSIFLNNLEPNKTYTLSFDTQQSSVTLEIAGILHTVSGSSFTFTTPASLSNKYLRTSDSISNVRLIEDDVLDVIGTLGKEVEDGLHSVKSAILNSCTLVNLWKYKLTANSTILEQSDTSVKIQHNSAVDTGIVTHGIRPLTIGTYLIVLELDLNGSSRDVIDIKEFDGVEDSGQWLNGKLLTRQVIDGNLQFIKFTTTRESPRLLISIQGTNGSVGDITTYKNVMLIEYQDGMENWDIPYFTGMQLVKTPVLMTVGENLVNMLEYTIRGGATVTATDVDSITFDSTRAWGGLKYLLTLKPFTQYTFSFDRSDIEIQGYIRFPKEDNDWSGGYGGGSKYTFTTDYTGLITFSIEGSIVKNNLTVSNIQMEQGATSSPYEPHKSNTLYTNTEFELRAIDSIHDGLNPQEKVKKERIGHITLTGSESENYTKLSTSLVNHSVFYTQLDNYTQDNAMKTILCDRFKSKDRLDIELESEYVSGRGGIGEFLWISISNEKASTVEELRQWLSTHPTTAQYVLATENVIPLDIYVLNQDNEKLSKLQPQSGVTHIKAYSDGLNGTLQHVDPSYPVVIKPSSTYHILANSFSNNHDSSPITYNLGGTSVTTSVGTRMVAITTPSDLLNDTLTISGWGSKINEVMAIDGEVLGDEAYFEEMFSVSMPVLNSVGKNLCPPLLQGTLSQVSGIEFDSTTELRSDLFFINKGRYVFSNNGVLRGTNVNQYTKDGLFVKNIQTGEAYLTAETPMYIRVWGNSTDRDKFQMEQGAVATSYESHVANTLKPKNMWIVDTVNTHETATMSKFITVEAGAKYKFTHDGNKTTWYVYQYHMVPNEKETFLGMDRLSEKDNVFKTFDEANAIVFMCMSKTSDWYLCPYIELSGIGDIQDTFDVRTGEVVKRIQKVIINCDNYPVNGYLELTDVVRGYIFKADLGVGDFINSSEQYYTFCDKFQGNSIAFDNTSETECVYVGYNAIYFKILKSRLSMVNRDGFTQWFKDNPTCVAWVSPKNIYKTIPLQCTDQDGNASSFHTFNELTHVSTSSETFAPILSHVNPSYPVMLKPSTKYSVVAEYDLNGHDLSPINFNLGGKLHSFTTRQRVQEITTPSTLSHQSIMINGSGNSLKELMVIEGSIVGNEPYFEGMQSVRMPVLHTVGKNLCHNVLIEANKGRVNESNGTIYRDSLLKPTVYVSDYIVINPFMKKIAYTRQNLHADGVSRGTQSYGLYDKNKNFIVGAYNTHAIEIPTNARFIRITLDSEQEFQLEYGSTTSYEPNKSNILRTLEPVELRGVGEVKDELHVTKTVDNLVENVYMYQITGDENWGQSGFTDDNYFVGYSTVTNNLSVRDSKVVSDKLKYDNTVSVSKPTVAEGVNIIGDSSLRISVSKSKVQNLSDFTNWLKTEMPIIYFVRKEKVIKTVDLSSYGNWEKVVLDGSESWTFGVNNGYGKAYINTKDKAYGFTNVFSEVLRTMNTYCDEPFSISGTPNNRAITVSLDESITTSNEFIQYLSQNPITVWYQTTTSKDNSIKELLLFENGHLNVEAESILPNLTYRAASSNYYRLPTLKPSTDYTLRYTGSMTQFKLGGNVLTAYPNNSVITSGSQHQQLLANGSYFNLQLIEGNVTSQNFGWFSHCKTVDDLSFQNEQLVTLQQIGLHKLSHSLQNQLDLVNQRVKRCVGKIECDGTEVWEIQAQSSTFIIFKLPHGLGYIPNQFNSYPYRPISLNQNQTVAGLSFDQSFLYLSFNLAEDPISTLYALEHRLQATSLVVFYELETATEESITSLDLVLNPSKPLVFNHTIAPYVEYTLPTSNRYDSTMISTNATLTQRSIRQLKLENGDLIDPGETFSLTGQQLGRSIITVSEASPMLFNGEEAGQDIPYFTGTQDVQGLSIYTCNRNVFDLEDVTLSHDVTINAEQDGLSFTLQDVSQVIHSTHHLKPNAVYSLQARLSSATLRCGDVSLTNATTSSTLKSGYISTDTTGVVVLDYLAAQENTLASMVQIALIEVESNQVSHPTYVKHQHHLMSLPSDLKLRSIRDLSDEVALSLKEVRRKIHQISLYDLKDTFEIVGTSSQLLKVTLSVYKRNHSTYTACESLWPVVLTENYANEVGYHFVDHETLLVKLFDKNSFTIEEVEAYLLSNPITLNYEREMVVEPLEGETNILAYRDGLIQYRSHDFTLYPTFNYQAISSNHFIVPLMIEGNSYTVSSETLETGTIIKHGDEELVYQQEGVLIQAIAPYHLTFKTDQVPNLNIVEGNHVGLYLPRFDGVGNVVNPSLTLQNGSEVLYFDGDGSTLRRINSSIYDTYKLSSGIFTKQIETTTLNGSESWRKVDGASNDLTDLYYMNRLADRMVGMLNLKCFDFKVQDVLNSTVQEEGICGASNDFTIYLRIQKSKLVTTTIEDYLAQHPFELYYELQDVEKIQKTSFEFVLLENSDLILEAEQHVLPIVTYQIPLQNSYTLTRLKANTVYTIKASSIDSFKLDQTLYEVYGTEFRFTTGESLPLYSTLTLLGTIPSRLILLEGDYIGREMPYFSGLASASNVIISISDGDDYQAYDTKLTLHATPNGIFDSINLQTGVYIKATGIRTYRKGDDDDSTVYTDGVQTVYGLNAAQYSTVSTKALRTRQHGVIRLQADHVLPTLDYRLPTSNHYVIPLLKPNTLYTLFANCQVEGQVVINEHHYEFVSGRLFTTGSDITSYLMTFEGCGEVSDVMVFEGAIPKQNFNYFDAFNSVKESVIKIQGTFANEVNQLQLPSHLSFDSLGIYQDELNLLTKEYRKRLYRKALNGTEEWVIPTHCLVDDSYVVFSLKVENIRSSSSVQTLMSSGFHNVHLEGRIHDCESIYATDGYLYLCLDKQRLNGLKTIQTFKNWLSSYPIEVLGLLDTEMTGVIYNDWTSTPSSYQDETHLHSEGGTSLKPSFVVTLAVKTVEQLVSVLKEKNLMLQEESLSTMVALTEVFEMVMIMMPSELSIIEIDSTESNISPLASRSSTKGGFQMVEVYATLIIKGRKTLEEVPAILRPQVEAMLKELGAL